ncbi:MAG: ABC-F family ATP-binding cassette domain-containing protein [Treponema sp.]|nr:ABC-F family ATP-binding cassette domain-containing protein [Treponema sp.]
MPSARSSGASGPGGRVNVSRVSLAFGDRDILKEVSLSLAAGSRACLAGANGSGKSTLMKVIAGKVRADSGDLAFKKGARIAYLPQSDKFSEPSAGPEGRAGRRKTLRDEAETAYGAVRAMLEKMEETGRELEHAESGGRRTAPLLEEYHRLQEAVENSGYYRREAEIAMVLKGLGFSEEDLERDTGEFSGGWQMRIALARALLEKPDILLLDEPTNYLDIEARSWLETWLAKFAGGCLLVSHDRYFLDVTVNEVYELFQGRLKRYAGNYTAYEKLRQIETESLLKRYAEQQEEIAKTEALIRRFRYKASKAAFAQELVKRLDKMEKIEIPESMKKIAISFPPPPRSGRVVLSLEGVAKSYGSRRVLSGLDLTVESGERLVVVGPNGAGKTTLLRIIAGADGRFEGNVRYGAGVAAGYFSQDSAEQVREPVREPAREAPEGGGRIIDLLEAEAPSMSLIPRLRDMLGAFLFRGDDVYKNVSVLSGGEKSRLALLRMLLKPVNLLILDEPTNHLDLYSKDILLDTLKRFPGTVVFVSHDRFFMEALSTKTLELSPGKHRFFYGNYGYYLDRLAAETAEAAGEPAEGPAPRRNGETAKGGAYRAEEKRRQALIRRLERQEAELLSALDALEQEKRDLEADLARPEVYGNGEKAKAAQAGLGAVLSAIEEKTGEWEQRAGELHAARQR